MPTRGDPSSSWRRVASVDTFPLGEEGRLDRFRCLLFYLPANRPDWSRSGFLSEIDVHAVGRTLAEVRGIWRNAGIQALNLGEFTCPVR